MSNYYFKIMSNTLSQITTKIVDVASIVTHGEQLTLPVGMSIKGAIDLLQRREKYDNEATAFSEKFNVLPFDGANALNEVLRQKYGWAQATATPSFFGPQPPQMLTIEVAPNVHKQVPWGRFSLPNLAEGGFVECDVQVDNGRYAFAVSARIKRVDEPAIRSLFADIRAYLKTGSIYMGQAVKIRFRDDDGDVLAMPQPSFIDTSKIDPESLIYAKDVMNSVQTNLFTPILRVHDCIKNGIPVKRGVLLGGTFGTGKTMAASVAAHHAVATGVTYLYIARADELAEGIEFAKQYQSPACVIFCEDVDRVTDGERDVELDEILNMLDGLDTKNANIITVLTTNDLHAINAAMLRPGRLDAVIDVVPPDAEAIEKLVRFYAGDTLAPDADLREVGKVLAGNIPAVVAEVCKRAKLSQLRLQPKGTIVARISSEAFVDAAKTMQAQVQLLRDRSVKPALPPTLDQALNQAIMLALEGPINQIEEIADQVKTIKNEVC